MAASVLAGQDIVFVGAGQRLSVGGRCPARLRRVSPDNLGGMKPALRFMGTGWEYYG